jgi:hypothetical protein
MNHSTQPRTTAPADLQGDPELQMFQRQLHRFAGDGDCAYERALSTLYRKLFEQRLRQLSALRSAGL